MNIVLNLMMISFRKVDEIVEDLLDFSSITALFLRSACPSE